MARSEIAEKLNSLLDNHTLWTEPEVIYLFVQTRKLLDHAKIETQQDSPHLRFYCDWTVHISKDRIDPITLDVVKKMGEGVEKQIKNPYMHLGEEAINFAYFRSFHEELIKLLKSEGIDTQSIESEDLWVQVLITLVKILENQPLNIDERHGVNLTSLIFLPAAPNCVIMRIDFREPIVGRDGVEYPYYTLKNAY